MTDNPIVEIMTRIIGMAKLHGIAFCKVTYDADTEVFSFTPLLAEFVTVSFEKKHD